MSDTTTETTPDEVTPFTEGDREIAYRSEANPTAAPGNSTPDEKKAASA